MSSRHGFQTGVSPWRRLALRGTLLAASAFGTLWLLLPERALQAAAPPAATLVSPNGGTVAVGKPYFLWNQVSTATEYRLKVDNSSGTTVIDTW